MQLIDETTRPRYPHWRVTDDAGTELGTVALTRLGRQAREFYCARAVDGCDLGLHRDRADAIAAVVTDAEEGHPRSARNPTQRYRPLYDGPEPLRPA
jgi:hypothetical protein